MTIHTANATHAIVSPMEREDLGLEEDMIGGLVGSSGISTQSDTTASSPSSGQKKGSI